jgi:hypothetical protein
MSPEYTGIFGEHQFVAGKSELDVEELRAFRPQTE